MTARGWLIVGMAALLGAAQIVAHAQGPAAAPPPPNFDAIDVEVLPIRANVSMLVGAGGNVTVQTGDEGVLLVDSGYEQMSAKVIAAIRKLSNKSLTRVINTTLMDSHTGGNAAIVKEGRVNQGGPGLGGRPNEATLTAHSTLTALMTGIGCDKIVPERWPVNVYDGKSKDLYSNDEPVIILHVPNGVTDGDSMVWFRKSDVVAAGEIFNEASFPYIDLAHGGSINGILGGLNNLLEITVPKFNQEGGTMVVPGYGRIADEHDVLEYRDMLTIIRDRVQASIKKGLTLAQVQALKPSPTYEYELRFNRDPAWTAPMFVEAIYKSLTAKR